MLRKFNVKMLLVALCAVGMLVGADNAQAAKKKNIGLQLYSVWGDMNKDAAGTIVKLGDMGYVNLEMAGYGDGKFYDMTPAEFRKLVKDNGMTVISSHINRGLKEGSYEEVMAWWDQAIADHKAVGAKYVVMPSPPIHLNEKTTTAELKAWADYMNDIGAKCKKAGLKFGFHNHAQEFQKVDGKIALEYLMENTNPDLVTFELDVYWITQGGYNPTEFINKHADRISLLHIKDVDVIGGSGTIDFNSIFDTAYKQGVVKYYFVEQEANKFTPLEGVELSYKYLNEAPFVK